MGSPYEQESKFAFPNERTYYFQMKTVKLEGDLGSCATQEAPGFLPKVTRNTW